MNIAGKKILLHDMCLRDGMHTKSHNISLDEMRTLSTALDQAGVPLIEVTHGDGLGGASVNYGFPAHSDREYLETVVPLMKNAKISALLIPGIGTVDHLRMVHEIGVHTIRVATHCTEADVSEQHIELGRKLGMDTVGFLMMAHMTSPENILKQALLMESYGANCIYCTDSAGYFTQEDVKSRIEILRDGLKPETEIGFHGHHNLALGVSNSLQAVESGASRIDGSVAGMGAGAGNTPLEVFNAVATRLGAETGVDVFKLMAIGEDIVVPLLDKPVRVDRDSQILGYAGVYSSFLLHANRASKKFGVPTGEILLELGRRKTVGGQEDMIEDVAMELIKRGSAKGQTS
jgi:4-hydroxy-2-oxovalerate/4-hydroxy-2-oxohexanoate aldolase